MIIACIALFAVLGGGAYAATLAVNSVGSKQVKKRSLKGKDLKNNALTGRQVNESKLGLVPRANRARVTPIASSAVDTTTVASLAGVAVVSTSITTKVPSTFQVGGSVELEGAESDEVGACRIVRDGVPISPFFETTFDDIGADNAATISVDGSQADVPPGTHLIEIRCSEIGPGNVGKDDAAINVLAVPNP